jgi:hypothetical protein
MSLIVSYRPMANAGSVIRVLPESFVILDFPRLETKSWVTAESRSGRQERRITDWSSPPAPNHNPL